MLLISDKTIEAVKCIFKIFINTIQNTESIVDRSILVVIRMFDKNARY